MRGTAWVETRLTEVPWPPSNFLQEMSSQDVRRWFDQCRMGCAAVNMNTWVCGDMKEKKSKALTVESMILQLHQICPMSLAQPTSKVPVVFSEQTSQGSQQVSLTPELKCPLVPSELAKVLLSNIFKNRKAWKQKEFKHDTQGLATLLDVQTHVALPHGIFFSLGRWLKWPIRHLRCWRESLTPSH